LLPMIKEDGSIALDIIEGVVDRYFPAKVSSAFFYTPG